MEELTEVITAAEFHPQSCNYLMYSSSKVSTQSWARPPIYRVPSATDTPNTALRIIYSGYYQVGRSPRVGLVRPARQEYVNEIEEG